MQVSGGRREIGRAARSMRSAEVDHGRLRLLGRDICQAQKPLQAPQPRQLPDSFPLDCHVHLIRKQNKYLSQALSSQSVTKISHQQREEKYPAFFLTLVILFPAAWCGSSIPQVLTYLRRQVKQDMMPKKPQRQVLSCQSTMTAKVC